LARRDIIGAIDVALDVPLPRFFLTAIRSKRSLDGIQCLIDTNSMQRRWHRLAIGDTFDVQWPLHRK
jgi:hypothetical protein